MLQNTETRKSKLENLAEFRNPSHYATAVSGHFFK